MGVAIIGEIMFCYKGKSASGKPKVSIAVRVTPDNSPIHLSGQDDLAEARFVTKEAFLQLPFQSGEETIQHYANRIWQA